MLNNLSVAIEVLEALRPLGVQAALDALFQSQNQTDERRRSLEREFLVSMHKSGYPGAVDLVRSFSAVV